MSALEQATKLILTPLLRGEASVLGAGDMEILLRWLTKTTYVAQGIGNWFASSDEMQVFGEPPHQPPLGFKAWIGHWRGGGGAEIWTYPWACRVYGEPRTGIKNSHFTMLAVGHVFFVALRTSAPEYNDFKFKGEDRWHLRRLSSVGDPVSWPPAMKMHHDVALRLRYKFVEGLNAT